MQEEATVCRNDPPGFLITNVEIIDGSGSPAFAADVRVNDGLIADMGELERCEGETVVDGGAQTLAPGFIDTQPVHHNGHRRPGRRIAVSFGRLFLETGRNACDGKRCVLRWP